MNERSSHLTPPPSLQPRTNPGNRTIHIPYMTAGLRTLHKVPSPRRIFLRQKVGNFFLVSFFAEYMPVMEPVTILHHLTGTGTTRYEAYPSPMFLVTCPLPLVSSSRTRSPGLKCLFVPSVVSISTAPVMRARNWRVGQGCQSPIQPG